MIAIQLVTQVICIKRKGRVIRLRELRDGKIVFGGGPASEGGENKVADVVVVNAAFKPHALCVVTQRQIHAVALFGFQVGVADVEYENTRMRPVIVKLFERRGAERMLVVGDKRSASPQRYTSARTAGKSKKVALAKIALRSVAVLLNAPAKLETHTLEIDSFQSVKGERVLFGVRRRSCFTD